MSKVAIAIPTYNRKEYLMDCLKSILAQSFRDFFIYIFDNHSDYDIISLIKNLNDNRIVLLRNEKNEGIFANFDKITNHNFGEKYVIIFHDDDTMHPDLLSKEVFEMEKNQSLAWVGAQMNFVHRGDMFNFKHSNKSNPILLSTKAEFIRLLLKNFNICYDSVLYRSECLKIHAKFAHRFYKWSDRPLLIKQFDIGAAVILPEKLVNYRLHDSQDSRGESSVHIDKLFSLFLFYRDNLPQPLNTTDDNLFNTWSANSIVISGLSFSKSLSDYYKFIKSAHAMGLFEWRCLNMRGYYYLAKVLVRLVINKIGIV